MRVPEDLYAYIGRKELRFSLHAGYIGIARSMASSLAVTVQMIFRELRTKGYLLSKIDISQIPRMINQHIRQVLQSFEQKRIESEGFDPIGYHDHIDECIAESLMDLQQCQYGSVSYKVKRLLEKESISVDPDSNEFNMFCRELLKAKLKMYQVELNRNAADYSDNIEALFPVNQPQAELIPSSITLEKLIGLYDDENQNAGNWAPTTIKRYKTFSNLLTTFIGKDTQLSRIEHSVMQKFKQNLQKLPSGFMVKPAYKGKSIPEIIAMKAEKIMSVATVNGYLTHASALFDYAVRNNYMTTNYAVGLKIKQKRKASEQKDPFSDEDLGKIFHSEDYVKDKHNKAWKYWVPIIGLYTGCRLEEMCQLHIDDIQQEEGIWYLDINKDAPDKSLKNSASIRLVPLHPFVVDNLNFIAFVNNLKDKGAKRLFPELNKNSGNKYSHAVSKWFGRFKTQCGIRSDKKTFHSFRHNVSDNLKQQMIETTLIDELTGHTVKGESLGRYGKPYVVKTLYENAVLKLNYNIDLSHLKNSKWVVRDEKLNSVS
jgi:integrase